MTGFSPVPYYCEENIWMLLKSDMLSGVDAHAVFISNPFKTAAFLHQKNGIPEEMVIWDYHVVALERNGKTWNLWDFNTDLGLPCSATTWFEETFRIGNLPDRFHSLFRPVPGNLMISSFISDRSHMRNPDGSYKATPPPWDCPGKGASNLSQFIDMDNRYFGDVYSLQGIKRFIDPLFHGDQYRSSI